MGDDMNFAFSPEQDELRLSVRRFLDDKSPMAEVRRLMETEQGYDRAVWKTLSEQLGLTGLAIPEQYGGYGYSSVEQTIVFEEMGRSLFCGPYFATVALGANAILLSGDESAKSDFLGGIAAGETIATLALTEETGNWDVEAIETTASLHGNSWLLQGSKSYVIDGLIADLILVSARTKLGISLFVVEKGAPNMTVTPILTMDTTRKMAKVRLDSTPARLLGPQGHAVGGLTRTLDLAVIALAAEQVGGAMKCLEMAVGYAKERIQFGRPIGSFQAIKHKCANVLLEVESAKSAAYYAGWVASSDSEELKIAAPLAKAFCSDAYFLAASENIQIHGGIGFTWEHDAHLYFKRAKSSEILFGDASYHREKLGVAVGI